MADVHLRMELMKFTPFNKWYECNDMGITVFNWFSWYIGTKLKKYAHLKPKVYAFFQKVFGDNTIESIFTSREQHYIINFVNVKPLNSNYPDVSGQTLLYYLVKHCENSSDIYYNRLYNLLMAKNAKKLTDEEMAQIQSTHVEEEKIPSYLKLHMSEITLKYKCTEKLIVQNIETKCIDFELTKCHECNELIDYTKEISKIIIYAKNNHNDYIMNLIWLAFYQRKLLNTIFDKYYELVNSQHELNQIHKRHTHILNIYTMNLM